MDGVYQIDEVVDRLANAQEVRPDASGGTAGVALLERQALTVPAERIKGSKAGLRSPGKTLLGQEMASSPSLASFLVNPCSVRFANSCCYNPLCLSSADSVCPF